jgi:predicted DsbA family dithiol-disulfide isomerase
VDRVRFDQLVREFDAQVVDVPFELREAIAPEGWSASEHGLRHSERVEAFIHKEAAAAGLPMLDPLPDVLPNTHRAIVMSEVARDAGPEAYRRVHDAVFGAYFGDGRDIASQDVLLEIARGAGIDPEAVRAAWGRKKYEDRVHAMRHLALSLGISSTPASLICNELLIGTRPYKLLAESMERCLLTRASVENAQVTGAGEERAHGAGSAGDAEEGAPPAVGAQQAAAEEVEQASARRHGVDIARVVKE